MNRLINNSVFLILFLTTISATLFMKNSVFLCILFLFLTLTAFRFFSNHYGYLNPISLFSLGWFSVMIVSSFPWHDYIFTYGEFSVDFWFAYWLCYCSFVTGNLILFKFQKSKFKSFFVLLPKRFRLNKRMSYLFGKYSIIFLLISLSSYTYMVLKRGYIPILKEDITIEFMLSNINYIYNIFGWLGLSFFFINLLFSKYKFFIKTSGVFLFFFYASYISVGKRWGILTLLLLSFFYVAFKYIIEKKFKVLIRIVVIGMLLILVLFYTNAALRIDEETLNVYWIKNYRTKLSGISAFFGIYAANYTWQNFTAFQECLEGDIDYMYGLKSLRGFINPFLSLDEQQTIFHKPKAVSNKHAAINWLVDFYQDFSWFGIVFFPFVLGLLTSKSYIYFLSNPIIGALVYSILVRCILLTFAKNTFSELYVWIYILTAFVIYKYFLNCTKGKRGYIWLE